MDVKVLKVNRNNEGHPTKCTNDWFKTKKMMHYWKFNRAIDKYNF